MPRLTMLLLLMLSVLVEAEIKPFPSARLLEQQQQPVDHYRLVISELKRRKATTQGEQERRLHGELNRRIWAVEPGFTLGEVSDFFQQQMKQHAVVYQCHGLDCGSSHFWANQVFDNSRLVGREQNQHYWVAQQAQGNDQHRIWVLYLVQRGSKQVYIALDQLITNTDIRAGVVDKQQIQQALQQDSGWLNGLYTQQNQLQSPLSNDLIDALKQLPKRDKHRLYLMVHCYDANAMADNLQCSKRLAKQLRLATFDGREELHILGQGALVAPPDQSLKPKIRFIFWPRR